MMLSFLLMAVMAYYFSRRYIAVNLFNWRLAFFMLLCLVCTILSQVFVDDLVFSSRLLLNIALLSGMTVFLFSSGLLNLKNLKQLFTG